MQILTLSIQNRQLSNKYLQKIQMILRLHHKVSVSVTHLTCSLSETVQGSDCKFSLLVDCYFIYFSFEVFQKI